MTKKHAESVLKYSSNYRGPSKIASEVRPILKEANSNKKPIYLKESRSELGLSMEENITADEIRIMV
ncbi:MAG: hypothetical protein MHPSP_002547, partial [Paramarteilia canceri]